jgi:hypothetical protein
MAGITVDGSRLPAASGASGGGGAGGGPVCPDDVFVTVDERGCAGGGSSGRVLPRDAGEGSFFARCMDEKSVGEAQTFLHASLRNAAVSVGIVSKNGVASSYGNEDCKFTAYALASYPGRASSLTWFLHPSENRKGTEISGKEAAKHFCSKRHTHCEPLETPSSLMDVVVLVDVNPLEFSDRVKDALRVLKPGGRIVWISEHLPTVDDRAEALRMVEEGLLLIQERGVLLSALTPSDACSSGHIVQQMLERCDVGSYRGSETVFWGCMSQIADRRQSPSFEQDVARLSDDLQEKIETRTSDDQKRYFQSLEACNKFLSDPQTTLHEGVAVVRLFEDPNSMAWGGDSKGAHALTLGYYLSRGFQVPEHLKDVHTFIFVTSAPGCKCVVHVCSKERTRVYRDVAADVVRRVFSENIEKCSLYSPGDDTCSSVSLVFKTPSNLADISQRVCLGIEIFSQKKKDELSAKDVLIKLQKKNLSSKDSSLIMDVLKSQPGVRRCVFENGSLGPSFWLRFFASNVQKTQENADVFLECMRFFEAFEPCDTPEWMCVLSKYVKCSIDAKKMLFERVNGFFERSKDVDWLVSLNRLLESLGTRDVWEYVKGKIVEDEKTSPLLVHCEAGIFPFVQKIFMECYESGLLPFEKVEPFMLCHQWIPWLCGGDFKKSWSLLSALGFRGTLRDKSMSHDWSFVFRERVLSSEEKEFLLSHVGGMTFYQKRILFEKGIESDDGVFLRNVVLSFDLEEISESAEEYVEFLDRACEFLMFYEDVVGVLGFLRKEKLFDAHCQYTILNQKVRVVGNVFEFLYQKSYENILREEVFLSMVHLVEHPRLLDENKKILYQSMMGFLGDLSEKKQAHLFARSKKVREFILNSDPCSPFVCGFKTRLVQIFPENFLKWDEMLSVIDSSLRCIIFHNSFADQNVVSLLFVNVLKLLERDCFFQNEKTFLVFLDKVKDISHTSFFYHLKDKNQESLGFFFLLLKKIFRHGIEFVGDKKSAYLLKDTVFELCERMYRVYESVEQENISKSSFFFIYSKFAFLRSMYDKAFFDVYVHEFMSFYTHPRMLDEEGFLAGYESSFFEMTVASMVMCSRFMGQCDVLFSAEFFNIFYRQIQKDRIVFDIYVDRFFEMNSDKSSLSGGAKRILFEHMAHLWEEIIASDFPEKSKKAEKYLKYLEVFLNSEDEDFIQCALREIEKAQGFKDIFMEEGFQAYVPRAFGPGGGVKSKYVLWGLVFAHKCRPLDDTCVQIVFQLDLLCLKRQLMRVETAEEGISLAMGYLEPLFSRMKQVTAGINVHKKPELISESAFLSCVFRMVLEWFDKKLMPRMGPEDFERHQGFLKFIFQGIQLFVAPGGEKILSYVCSERFDPLLPFWNAYQQSEEAHVFFSSVRQSCKVFHVWVETFLALNVVKFLSAPKEIPLLAAQEMYIWLTHLEKLKTYGFLSPDFDEKHGVACARARDLLRPRLEMGEQRV